MDNQYEQCRNNLYALAGWYNQNKANRNEATTRFHLINSLFLDCLGWNKADIEIEHQENGERTDYEFYAPRKVLIVEAKREGKYFELPISTNKRIEFSIPALRRDYTDVKMALFQVSDYCQHRGVPFGAVCNGHQIILFIASRRDGQSPLDGRALVFDSLQTMLENFVEFWNVLSKPAVEDRQLYTKLLGDQKPQIPMKLSATIANYPGIKKRNIFQTNLKILSDLVLEDIAKAPQLEDRFLRDCYCQSGALSQNSLLAKQILRTRYAALFDTNEQQPILVPATSKKGVNPDLLSESVARRPILLLGDVGVGKTIFMNHLFKIEAASILKDTIILNIDLGSQVTLATDLRKSILDIFTTQLRENYKIDIDKGTFVRMLYRKDLERFHNSIYKDIKELNPDAFNRKELEFLEDKLQNRDQHIKCVLQHLVETTRKQALFFLDNADQRTEEGVQEQVFLIAQEIAQNWLTMVFVTLRPETFHHSLKSGTLSGYHPKAFTISPPRIDRVLEKRLKFAILVAQGQIPIELKSSKIELSSLVLIMKSFLESMVHYPKLVDFLDNISSGNIRLALDLVRQFFGSGHINTEKIIQIYKASNQYYIPLHEFLRSVIYGDSEYYDPPKSCITNIFDITTLDPKEHFLIHIMINFLNNEGRQRNQHGFVAISQVYDKLQGLGYMSQQIDSAIVQSSRNKLIETEARKTLAMPQPMPALLRTTSVGLYHVDQLTRLFSYVDAMIVDTPILDKKTRESIYDVKAIEDRLNRAEIFRNYLNEQWNTFDNTNLEFDWKVISHDLETDITNIKNGLAKC